MRTKERVSVVTVAGSRRLQPACLIVLVAIVCFYFTGTALAGFGVDLSTLSATYEYPIMVPPGIQGLQPGISLHYHSGGHDPANPANPARDWLGENWYVGGFPYIENIGGTYYYIDGRGYRGKQELVQELKPDGNPTNRFHLKAEDYSYIYYRKDVQNDFWYIMTKDGTRYDYGTYANGNIDICGVTVTSTNSRTPAPPATTTRWYLDRITDTNCNTIAYYYTAVGDARYPNVVKYNTEQGRTITFGLGDRPAGEESGAFTKRIVSIDVKAGTDRLRYYAFIYSSPTDSGDSNYNFPSFTPYAINEYGTSGSGDFLTTKLRYDNIGTPTAPIIGPLNFVMAPQGGMISIGNQTVTGTDPMDSNVTTHVTGVVMDNGLGSNPLHVSSLTTYIDAGTGTNERSVVVRDPAGNDTKYTFDTGGGTVQLKGALKKVSAYQGTYTAGSERRRVESNWMTQSITGVSGVLFPYISLSTTIEGTGLTKDTGYVYDFNTYGNLKEVWIYADNSATVEKKVITEYITCGEIDCTGDPAADSAVRYLVATPKRIYTTDGSGNVLFDTRYAYDGSDYGILPTLRQNNIKGNVTKTKIWIEGTTWAETTYTYDSYGNVTSTTDPNGNPASVVYDSTYNTFPTQVTNAKSQSTSGTYDFATGQIKTATDLNSKTTTYVYDSFKRLQKVFSPLDDIPNNYPGVKYEYSTPSTPPWKTVVKQRTDPYTGYTHADIYTFVDGFSKVIQTKAPAEPDPATGQTRQLITNARTFYDSGKLVSEEYLPYFVSPASTDFVTADTGKPKTRTEFDALGRAAKITRPDGTYTTYTYGYDWSVKQEDFDSGGAKLGQSKKYFDGEGRLTKVEVWNNYDDDGNPATPNYSTCPTTSPTFCFVTRYSYEYTPFLRVTSTDPKGNTATQTYDALGRLRFSDDPNAGQWDFTYDSGGNLRTTIDGRGRQITFTYDELNRLKTKSGQ